MCELTVYTLKGDGKELVMDGVVRLTAHDGKVLLEGILGDSMDVAGRLFSADIIAQEAVIATD
jgi:predicted RNA-binding protein